jgi:hypothetical protein
MRLNELILENNAIIRLDVEKLVKDAVGDDWIEKALLIDKIASLRIDKGTSVDMLQEFIHNLHQKNLPFKCEDVVAASYFALSDSASYLNEAYKIFQNAFSLGPSYDLNQDSYYVSAQKNNPDSSTSNIHFTLAVKEEGHFPTAKFSYLGPHNYLSNAVMLTKYLSQASVHQELIDIISNTK